jgi:hypothetical protein
MGLAGRVTPKIGCGTLLVVTHGFSELQVLSALRPEQRHRDG